MNSSARALKSLTAIEKAQNNNEQFPKHVNIDSQREIEQSSMDRELSCLYQRKVIGKKDTEISLEEFQSKAISHPDYSILCFFHRIPQEHVMNMSRNSFLISRLNKEGNGELRKEILINHRPFHVKYLEPFPKRAPPLPVATTPLALEDKGDNDIPQFSMPSHSMPPTTNKRACTEVERPVLKNKSMACDPQKKETKEGSDNSNNWFCC